MTTVPRSEREGNIDLDVLCVLRRKVYAELSLTRFMRYAVRGCELFGEWRKVALQIGRKKTPQSYGKHELFGVSAD